MIEGTTKGGGSIEVICGSMFSGKTSELQRRVKRAQIARLKVRAFKPSMEDRYHPSDIVSHDQNGLDAIPVTSPSEIVALAGDAELIAIDEAQFFNLELVETCLLLANEGKRIIVSGLDMDYTGQPYGPMPNLLAIADHVAKLHAICVGCGQLASFTYRTTTNDQLVELGGAENYEALCRPCFVQRRKNSTG